MKLCIVPWQAPAFPTWKKPGSGETQTAKQQNPKFLQQVALMGKDHGL